MNPTFTIRSGLPRALPLPFAGLAAALLLGGQSPAARSPQSGGEVRAAAGARGAPQDPERAGLGIGLRLREGRFMVEQLAPGGAAEKAGVEVGDQIVAIDGAQLDGLTLDDAVARIQGKAGSKAKLELRRDDRAVRLVAVRQALGRATPPQTEPTQPPTRDPQPTPGPGSKSLMLVRRTVLDPAVENRPGFTYFVPKEWRSQAAVAWDRDSSMLATMRLELDDPNTGTHLSWLPMAHFSFMPNPPGQIALGGNWMGATFLPPPADANAFVQMYWAAQTLPHLRGLEPKSVEPRPKLAQEYQRSQPGWTANAVRVRYEYESGGRAFEEDVYFVLNFAPNSGTQIQAWNVQAAVACRARKGGLERQAGLIQALLSNAVYTPEWLASYGIVKQLFQQRMLSWQQDTVRFGEQLRQYNAQIASQSQQIHEDRMRSWDRVAQSQREYLGGVETYTDPYENRGIYMPAGYKSYWVNQKGEYLLSELASFDPNVGGTEDWRKLPRRDPMKR